MVLQYKVRHPPNQFHEKLRHAILLLEVRSLPRNFVTHKIQIQAAVAGGGILLAALEAQKRVSHLPHPDFFTHLMGGAFLDAFAGINGGFVTVVVGQPFDTVKVLLQTNQHGHQLSATRCALDTYRTRGVVGLYAGSAPSILAHVYENAFLFMFYEQFNRLVPRLGLQSVQESNPFLVGAVGGGIAASLSAVLLTPIELVKCQLQSQTTTNYSSSVIIRSILNKHGITGMFTGLGPIMAREIPGNIVMFGGYEGTKRFLQENTTMSRDAQTLMAGGVSGMCFWGVSLPMDTITARQQVHGIGSTASKNVFRCLSDVVVNEGFRALYSGFGPVMVRAFLTNAAMFYAVEETKRILSSTSAHRDENQIPVPL